MCVDIGARVSGGCFACVGIPGGVCASAAAVHGVGEVVVGEVVVGGVVIGGRGGGGNAAVLMLL